ncbi:hypothetical protein AN4950.2 [Aspergillus nidulans FGSC A4]|uniref:Uncharacterized protein n=1 Tax=Emericella nidulans (strain FGSC A4 / ATCC 38163 / CBS 112.46 / NRRL 194 / M139) TaxID=227321 RepID=Q5B3D0_EMENI|nr:hypothetical protein [Aspergillus nidulans FGSC A4]EAA61028.1 hypothetical protein AN4950.2 [Aspergillus nidulans FGSC A4]CBF76412.1 TPA: conserved hypothetical protein [Aspergillus nidulans FGSC A4]|eukprot:XP_662554.1 hypothetical protein AN4950.2 [Aspergillus nidulans FGSC A4]
MHTSAVLSLALALTSNAFPLSHPTFNTTVQRRSADYDVVNVGGLPDTPQPAPSASTITQTVTAPGAPPQTVTVTISQTPTTPSPSSSAIWGAGTGVPYSSSAILPAVTPVPGEEVQDEEETATGAIDRLARAFGRSMNSHLRARTSNETAAYPRFDARGLNETGSVHVSRGLLNSTELVTSSRKARSLNSTALRG